MKTYNWDLTICNRADLLCDWEFVDKELIKEIKELQAKLKD